MKIYWAEFNKYRKILYCKISSVFDKTLVLPIICSNCSNNDRKFKEGASITILKFLGLTDNINEKT